MVSAIDLEIDVPVMRYAHTAPLFDGRVSIPGVKLNPVPVTPVVYDDVPDLRDGSFGLCDLNIGYFLPAVEAGWQIVGIPVFAARRTPYGALWCRTDRGIESPADLAGKSIATRTYRTAFTIWCRGFLRHRHDVDTSAIRWVTQMNEFFPIFDENMLRDPGDNSRSHPLDAVQAGDVDAALAHPVPPRSFETLENDPRVKRVFPSYVEEDQRLFKEIGFYTPIRVLVMSKKLDEEYPDLAARILAGFQSAKEMAYADAINDRIQSPLLYPRELFLEQQRAWGDPFAYGIKANRLAIDTFTRFNHEQGLIRAPLSDEQVFAASTLDR